MFGDAKLKGTPFPPSPFPLPSSHSSTYTVETSHHTQQCLMVEATCDVTQPRWLEFRGEALSLWKHRTEAAVVAAELCRAPCSWVHTQQHRMSLSLSYTDTHTHTKIWSTDIKVHCIKCTDKNISSNVHWNQRSGENPVR